MAIEQVSTELLRGFSPLDGLKRDNLAALARKVQIRELSPGQLLFKEGDTEKRTIYVVSGILELVDQAKVVGKVEALNRVVGPMPLSPLSRRCQTFSMLSPRGVTHPIPVTTTRRRATIMPPSV